MPNVTLKDVYEAVERIETKLDGRIDRLEQRISTLEQFKVQILVIGSLAVFALTFLKDLILSKVVGKSP